MGIIIGIVGVCAAALLVWDGGADGGAAHCDNGVSCIEAD